jgi:single-stranded DNA-binding protein
MSSVAILISGSIFREPQQRTSASGKRYVVTTLKAAAAENATSDFWSVLAFGDTAGNALMNLAIGERVTIQGGLKLEVFEKDGQARISRSIFADHVMALRQPPKDRKPKAKEATTSQGLPLERGSNPPTTTVTDPDLDDQIPF